MTDPLNIATSFGLGAVQTAVYKANIKDYSPDPGIGVSKSLGTLVYSNLDISGATFRDNNGVTRSIPAIKFDTVLFNVDRQTNLVATDVQGLDGSVKEYISQKDYFIRCYGIITGSNNKYPYDDVANAIKVFNAPISLSVNSWYLNQFGIYNIVIVDRRFMQTIGVNSYEKFEFAALSDQPIELLLNQK